MTKSRSKDTYKLSLEDFNREILVVCPKCSQKAKCTTVKSEIYTWTNAFKITCVHCGYNKIYESSRLPVSAWLRIPCQGYMIWALNYEHLEKLKQHIEAFLRERNTVPNRNSSMGSRLPRWMTSKKNRAAVLKCIEKLQEK